jgi:hypothetical protein
MGEIAYTGTASCILFIFSVDKEFLMFVLTHTLNTTGVIYRYNCDTACSFILR